MTAVTLITIGLELKKINNYKGVRLSAVEALFIKKLSDKFILNEVELNNYNRLGVIIKNVSSSVFCAEKRNKKCIENRF